MGEGGLSQQTSVSERPALKPSVGVLRLDTSNSESATSLATQQKSSPQGEVSDDRQTQVLAPPRPRRIQNPTGQRWADMNPDEALENGDLGEIGDPVPEVNKEIYVSAHKFDALPSKRKLTEPMQELQSHGEIDLQSWAHEQGIDFKVAEGSSKSAIGKKKNNNKAVTSSSSDLHTGAQLVNIFFTLLQFSCEILDLKYLRKSHLHIHKYLQVQMIILLQSL